MMFGCAKNPASDEKALDGSVFELTLQRAYGFVDREILRKLCDKGIYQLTNPGDTKSLLQSIRQSQTKCMFLMDRDYGSVFDDFEHLQLYLDNDCTLGVVVEALVLMLKFTASSRAVKNFSKSVRKLSETQTFCIGSITNETFVQGLQKEVNEVGRRDTILYQRLVYHLQATCALMTLSHLFDCVIKLYNNCHKMDGLNAEELESHLHKEAESCLQTAGKFLQGLTMVVKFPMRESDAPRTATVYSKLPQNLSSYAETSASETG
ncbi:hypothetical protein RvY_15323-2 [Ramazzottius varieornatus]|nr:hypothetical protein RvY_15323-2 [Ramazzottius varieornatus]